MSIAGTHPVVRRLLSPRAGDRARVHRLDALRRRYGVATDDEQEFHNLVLVPSVIVAIQDLAYLRPDPNDPNLSRGDVTLLESNQPESGGFDTIKQVVRWEIRRRRLP
jgi:hypothetical protein